MTDQTAAARPDAALAPDRLGVGSLLFFVLAAAGPLMNLAGTFPVAYAVTGNLALPAAFVVVAAVLLLFVPGYVAMGRHLRHAGALYAYASAGLGRAAGVGTAWVALAAYNMLQVGVYGALGAAVSPLVEDAWGLHLPWYVYAGAGWALVAVLGLFRVELNGRVLAALTVVEVLLIVVLVGSFLTHPAHGLALRLFSPAELAGEGAGPMLAIAALGFIGFESTVAYAEEARDHVRSVARASYLGVLVIGSLYAVSSWALAVTVGTAGLEATAQEQGAGLVFSLATTQLGHVAGTVGNVLFATSLVAALISFHNTIARYAFALGREGMLPAAFGRTSTTGTPWLASAAQSGLALVVLVAFTASGLDPLVDLFFVTGASGALGIVVLLLTTSGAVLGFFARDRRGERTWPAAVAPLLALLAVATVLWLVLSNFAGLLGVAPDHPLRWGVPALYAALLVGGLGYGAVLRSARPAVYAAIGSGAERTALAATAA